MQVKTFKFDEVTITNLKKLAKGELLGYQMTNTAVLKYLINSSVQKKTN